MKIEQQHHERKRESRDKDLRRRHERQTSHCSRLHLPRMPFSTGKEFRSVRSYQKAALITGALLVTMIFLLSKRNVTDGRYELQPLYPRKQQTQSPIVCSHQVLKPPPFLKGQEWLSNAAGESSHTPTDGSLDAMSSLWYNAGVTCFDIDVVVLSDGSMISSHPRRLAAAIENERKGKEGGKGEIVLEEFTLTSIRDALGLRQNARVGSSRNDDVAASPFPLFDTEVLPHFARLVNGIPGAFSSNARSTSSPPAPWDLKGPLLNIDLKQGPYLTKDRVLKLAKQIHALGLEDYVAVCTTAPPPPPATKGNGKGDSSTSSSSSSLDLLEFFHNYNTRTASKRIPLGLVLRDLVPEDNNVDRIRELVEDLHPESIKALVPSFKFSNEFYHSIRDPKRSRTETVSKNELWRLPMIVWTIDSKEDYIFVSSITTTTKGYRSSDNSNTLPIPIVSGMVANSPLEIM